MQYEVISRSENEFLRVVCDAFHGALTHELLKYLGLRIAPNRVFSAANTDSIHPNKNR